MTGRMIPSKGLYGGVGGDGTNKRELKEPQVNHHLPDADLGNMGYHVLECLQATHPCCNYPSFGNCHRAHEIDRLVHFQSRFYCGPRDDFGLVGLDRNIVFVLVRLGRGR